MKWVAITLLLLNGLYLAIQFNQDQPPVQQVDRFPFSGPRLTLRVEQEKFEKAKQFAEKNRQKILAQAKTAAAPKPEPAVEAPAKPAASAAPVPTPEPVAKPAPAPVVAPKPAPKPAPLSAPKPAPQPIAPAPSKSNAVACYSVGPFLLISDVKGVGQLFNIGNIATQERAEALRKQVGYWVYVPPMASLQVAQGALHQIKENGHEDALIIAEGTKANAVSIGVFKTESLGIEHKQEIIKLGYEAKVEPLFRTQPQYWLDIELMKSTKIPDKLWREVQAGYPNIQQLRHKCE